MDNEKLLAYSDGSYSTSDWGCAGDTIAISPRPYPVPGYLKMYATWAQALQEATDTCALQNGPCWVLRADQLGPRCGQPAYGGCPSCNSPGLQGFGPGAWPDAVRREVQANWKPVAVVTGEGVAKVLPDGCVLPLWQRIFDVSPPDRIVRERAGLDYRSAVAAAMQISQQMNQVRVVNGLGSTGDRVPVVYVQPGGLVRAASSPRGNEVVVTRMDPFEVQQAFMASRGGSIMPFGM